MVSTLSVLAIHIQIISQIEYIYKMKKKKKPLSMEMERRRFRLVFRKAQHRMQRQAANKGSP